MKDRKTVLNRFTPWQFDGEVYDLERASEKGWQLVRRTKRRRMYAYNPAVRYRYAVDFQYGYDDPAYLPCFEEQGWESLGFVARGEAQRWYFFRRPYDPSLPEEAYYIYTDEASLRQMKQMYARASLTLGVLLLWLVTSVPLRYDTGVTVCALLVFLSALWVVVFNLLQRRSVKKLRPGGCNRRRLRWAALWAPCLTLFLLAVTSGVAHSFPAGTLYGGAAADAPETIAFTVKLPDFYRLEITETLPDGANAMFALTDGDGTVLASDLLAELEDRTDPASYTLFLTPGSYTLSTSLDAAAPPGTDTSAVEGDILYVLN